MRCVGNDDVCAFGGKSQGMCTPLPAGTSGDKCDPTVQSTHSRLR
jgi:hypothetical protein